MQSLQMAGKHYQPNLFTNEKGDAGLLEFREWSSNPNSLIQQDPSHLTEDDLENMFPTDTYSL